MSTEKRIDVLIDLLQEQKRETAEVKSLLIDIKKSIDSQTRIDAKRLAEVLIRQHEIVATFGK